MCVPCPAQDPVKEANSKLVEADINDVLDRQREEQVWVRAAPGVNFGAQS